ncbi:putative small, acid-soluble spore protein beta [Intestinibacter bartlettii DSM 16795]|nr:putative small, acid-soluble spore protein beta [Intestinibacter bartlettii DSM 16795]
MSQIVCIIKQIFHIILPRNKNHRKEVLDMSNNNNNKTAVPQAKQALNQMKLEIANELGMADYQQVDKGNLTARQNGYVGGYMTKKLVEMAEQQMAGKGQQ